MANRQALRELQTRLASRLQAARTEAKQASWLAVECAGHGLLFPLASAGEIFPAGTLLPVPHTQPWFLGVANLPGRIATDASALYARNLFAFAGLFLNKEGAFAPDYEDEILKAALVTQGGQVVHPNLKG